MLLLYTYLRAPSTSQAFISVLYKEVMDANYSQFHLANVVVRGQERVST